MQRVRQRDTDIELALRSTLHRIGSRFRVQRQLLPAFRRKADIVFVKARVVVFVDGCFWHGCPRHGTQPKINRIWWCKKIAANVQRDRDTDKKLKAAKWCVIRVWEHESTGAAF